MDVKELNEIAKIMVAQKKGILAELGVDEGNFSELILKK